jgi:uncharacterized protein (TIGR03083 family)
MPDDNAEQSTAVGASQPVSPALQAAPSQPDAGAAPLLPTPRHLDTIRERAAALAEHAASAGWEADVPTCPRWTVADLVAHQGMVHRWAASSLRGDGASIPSKTDILRDVPLAALLGWFAEGVDALLATFAATPDDAEATVFLNDAPPPRAFWARRQAHEVTIHATDALAADLGRFPTAEEVGVDRDLALDGIDELLRGFFTRGRSGLAGGDPFTVEVRPSDADSGWRLHIGTERIVTERIVGRGPTPGPRTTPSAPGTAHLRTTPGTPPPPTPAPSARPDEPATPNEPATPDEPATVFTGSAAQLYLGLWNRGTEITATGRTEVLDRWREVQRVRWS